MVPNTDVAAVVALPHIAFARCAPIASSASSPPLPDDEAWLAACHRLTPRVERVAPACALLDLGACSDREAIDALRAFHARLHTHGLRARFGLGATATHAQLALLTAPAWRVLAHVSRDEAADFLRSVPVAVLAQLHPVGRITPETVERLQRYGLRTLGHIDRLPERALRRQFGAMAGAFLAAVAHGEDPTPLCPTAAPAWLRFRPRLDLPASPSRVAAALPAVASHLAGALHMAGRRARALRVRVGWERGAVAATELRLRAPTDDARLLAAELHRALAGLLAGDERDGDEALGDLRIALGDLAPAAPEQTALWQACMSRRREALARLAGIEDSLARRHGHAVLRTLRICEPDTIFDERRYRADTLLPSGDAGDWAATPRAVPATPTTRAAGEVASTIAHGIHWW